MKLKKAAIWFFILICCAVTFVFVFPNTGLNDLELFTPDVDKIVSDQDYDGSNYQTLTVKEKYIYGLICENHKEHKTDFRMSEEVTADEMTNVFTAVKFDFPDRGCLEDTYSFVQKGNYFYYSVKYWLSYEDCCERSEKCTEEAQRIALLAKDKSDYDKTLFFHDFLTQRTLYSESLENEVFTAYGAFFDGKANCSGFTAAMSMLLDFGGVENGIILGEAKDKRDGQENVLHVWNVVTTDKGSGHVDVAWDASDQTNDLVNNHTYFYLSDEEISKDHVIFDKYKGFCPVSEGSYFQVNGTYFESWSENEQRKTGSLLADAVDSGETVEIKFKNESDYTSAANYLFNKNGAYDLMYMFCDNREKIPSELTYYVNDNQYTIFIKLS